MLHSKEIYFESVSEILKISSKLKLFIHNITYQHEDRLVGLRHKTLVYFCLFQLGYCFLLLIYGILVPVYFRLFLSAFLLTFPINVLAIYFSKKNYKITALVYFILFFILSTIYLFIHQYNQNISNITAIQYFVISILGAIIVSFTFGVILFSIGFVSQIIDNILFSYGDIGIHIKTFNVFEPILFNGLYIAFMFGFFVFLIKNFIRYYDLYTCEISKTKVLNDELKVMNKDLNVMNSHLEKHIMVIEDANHRFNRYVWMNAHKVRGPIARIRGLLYISKIDKGKLEFYQEKINEEVVSLDQIVIEMNDLLGELELPENIKK